MAIENISKNIAIREQFMQFYNFLSKNKIQAPQLFSFFHLGVTECNLVVTLHVFHHHVWLDFSVYIEDIEDCT